MVDWHPLATLLSADIDPARPVALTAAGTQTWSDFRRRVRAWQAAFADSPGQRFALYSEDSLEFAAALFGAWHVDKTVCLPGDALPATLSRLSAEVDGFAGDLPDAMRAANDHRPHPDAALATLDPDTTRLFIYTSGSSGEPVSVEKRLRQLENEVAALEQRFGAAIGDATVYGTVAHQHIYGLLFRVLWPLVAGRPLVAARLAYPEQIASMIGPRPAVLVSSPAQLKRLPEHLAWQGTQDALRAVFSSGGPLPEEASVAVHALWRQSPIEVFGSTETGGIASRQGSGQAWEALPGVEWRLDDEILEIRSPHLADHEWFRTQDRAAATPAGFALLGRADRIVKLEERRISLSAIEQRLLSSPWLSEARVLPLPGKRTVLGVVAVPTAAGLTRLATEGKRQFVQALREFLADHVDAIAIPKQWRFVEVLPCNAQGKTTENALAALFGPVLPMPHWLERGADRATLRLDVMSGLTVLDGHFPAMTLLPGVAMLDWAIRFGRDAFPVPAVFTRMDNLKFQLMVRPGTQLDLQLDWQASTGGLSFRYSSAAGMHASGRVLFTSPEARA